MVEVFVQEVVPFLGTHRTKGGGFLSFKSGFSCSKGLLEKGNKPSLFFRKFFSFLIRKAGAVGRFFL